MQTLSSTILRGLAALLVLSLLLFSSTGHANRVARQKAQPGQRQKATPQKSKTKKSFLRRVRWSTGKRWVRSKGLKGAMRALTTSKKIASTPGKTTTLYFPPASSIESAALRLVDAANANKARAQGSFNRVSVYAEPGTKPETVVQRYLRDLGGDRGR